MFRIIPILALAILINGCSSIINGTTQKITVTSNVTGAEVQLNGASIGRTPVTTRVKREKTSLLIVRKEGYSDYQQQLQTKLDGWFWGNVLIGGFTGSTTDAATGSTHLLDPDTIFVQMEPVGGTAVSANAAQDAELRTFVTNSYANLVKDIKAGKGDYLKSLLVMLKVSDDQKKITLDKLRSMVTLYSTVHEFAEEIVRFSNKSR